RFAVVLFCVASLWLLSSWETWWYGGSFSQRAAVDGMGIWAFGFAAFFATIKKNQLLQLLVFTQVLVFIGLNIFQTNQYYEGVIDPERMTGAYYRASFLKTTVTHKDVALKEVSRDNTTGVYPDTAR